MLIESSISKRLKRAGSLFYENPLKIAWLGQTKVEWLIGSH